MSWRHILFSYDIFCFPTTFFVFNRHSPSPTKPLACDSDVKSNVFNEMTVACTLRGTPALSARNISAQRIFVTALIVVWYVVYFATKLHATWYVRRPSKTHDTCEYRCTVRTRVAEWGESSYCHASTSGSSCLLSTPVAHTVQPGLNFYKILAKLTLSSLGCVPTF